MPKELVVVPGAVAKKTIITDDGYAIPSYEQIPHLGTVAMDVLPDDWMNIRTHAKGLHICAQKARSGSRW